MRRRFAVISEVAKKIKDLPSAIRAVVTVRRDEIRDLAGIFIVLGTVLMVLQFLYSSTYESLTGGLLFDPKMPTNIALEIFRGIMQVDGVLIGFVGLMATYILADIRRVSVRAWRSMALTADRMKKQKETIEKLESRRTYTLWVTALTIGLLVSSIVLALRSMSYLATPVVIEDFFLPSLLLLYGAVFTFVLLMLSTGLPSHSE